MSKRCRGSCRYIQCIALATLLIPHGPLCLAQPELLIELENMSGIVEEYSPGDWLPDEPFGCWGLGTWPRYGTFNDMMVCDQIPVYGYPLKYSTFAGVNDTVQVAINWINYTDSEYALAAQKPETWFVPRVFQMDDASTTGIAWRDSMDLGYRVRGWILDYTSGLQLTPAKIPKRMDGGWSMLLDVWNLPEGHFSLCIDTTANVPSDFIGRTGGDNYWLRKPQDVADTINAYEAIFRRALRDRNLVAARQWIEQILTVHPTSVPGWWLRAMYYGYEQDTTEIIASYDKALELLNTNADPAMPDSTERLLFDAEKRYVHWVRERLAWERGWYAP